ncbi:hypothetical protein ACFL6K_03785 [Candidatus Latescibacterota bacterium]
MKRKMLSSVFFLTVFALTSFGVFAQDNSTVENKSGIRAGRREARRQNRQTISEDQRAAMQKNRNANRKSLSNSERAARHNQRAMTGKSLLKDQKSLTHNAKRANLEPLERATKRAGRMNARKHQFLGETNRNAQNRAGRHEGAGTYRISQRIQSNTYSERRGQN